jgi:DNA-binding CsgD family transcriptional regulator
LFFENIIIGFYLFSALLHFCFFLTQKFYKEHVYYSFFILSICLSYFLKNNLSILGLSSDLLNIFAIITMMINAVALALFCYSIFDLIKIRKYMIITLPAVSVMGMIAIVIFSVTKNYFYQKIIFYIPLSVGLFVFIILFLYNFIRLNQYKVKEKNLFLIGILLFIMTQIPAAIIKWSVNQDTDHIFLITAIPIMIMFEIALINKYRITERRIRLLEDEMISRQNDKSFELLFDKIGDEFKLTERERQIIKLLIKGNEAKDISKDLGIAYNTVRNFKQKIYEKLKVRNTIELINLFLK